MRIDLTEGAFRILTEADRISRPKGISVAAVLLALFEETECRAFQWLEEANIPLEDFRLKFGLYEGLAGTLQMPISAPMYPAGDYGIPPGYYQSAHASRNETVNVSAGSPGGYPAGYDPTPEPERHLTEHPHEKKDHFAPFAKTAPDTISPFRRGLRFAKPKEGDAISWFLNEESVRLSKVQPEFELALFAMLGRVRKQAAPLDTSLVLGAGGMVVRVKPNYELGFADSGFLLASEHLLFVVVLAEDDLGVGDWIRQQGLDPKTLLEKIDSLYNRGPDFPFERPAETRPERQSETRPEQPPKTELPPIPKEDRTGEEAEKANDVDAVDEVGNIDTTNKTDETDNVVEIGETNKAEETDATDEPASLPDRLPFEDSESSVSPTSRFSETETGASKSSPFFSSSGKTNGDGTGSEVERNRLFRILDAAANRGREAIRVLEDYVRFVLDDPYLTRLLKEFRHEMSGLLRELPDRDRLFSRETDTDVGTAIEGDNEYRRQGLGEVIASNFARLQESLRSLEEFSKIVSVPLAKRLEQLRYRCYTLHKVVASEADSRQRLEGASLYVLVDCRHNEGEFTQLIRSLVEAGVGLIQLRDKRAEDRLLLERGRILRELTAGSKTLFIMNDRADLARLTKADGLHIGQEELRIREARDLLGNEALIGLSTHSVEQARRAVLEGANYIGVGPVFPSSTKSFQEFPGPALLRAVAEEIRIPAFAIGGITSENLDTVLECGFRRIAVGSTILEAIDPGATARQLRKRLQDQ